MNRALLTTAAIVFIVSSQANAATRTFYSPNLHGDRISACIGAGTVCGKPVADQLCNSRGFEQALTYRLDRSQNDVLRMRTIENKIAGVTNAEPSFVFVKCYTPEVKTTLISQ